MSNIQFANKASTVLASPISSGATSVTLATGTGTKFPTISGGQYFLMTFVDAGTGLLTEIVKVTARSGDTCTIVRAQEGTSAQAWLAGDTAANFMTAGSIAALQSGFPTGSGAISTTTTLSLANTGNLYRVSGTGTVVSLPAASSVSGMTVGFSCQALGGCQIVSLGGVFAGGATDGDVSIDLAATDFLCVQSNGTIWVIFAATPDVLVGGIVATEAWVTGNFDPLGAAAAALAAAESYAAALQGNYAGTNIRAANYTLVSADFGKLVGLSAAAAADRTFTTINGTVDGQAVLYENLSTTKTLTILSGTAAKFSGSGLSVVGSFAIGPGNAAIVEWNQATGSWSVPFLGDAYDPAGSAASALAAAEVYADALQGNQRGLLPETGDTTFTTDDFGYIISLQGAVIANAIFSIPVPQPGKVFWVENNTTFTLTLQVDGTTNYFHGLTNTPWSSSNVPSLIVPPSSALLVYGHNVSWVEIGRAHV